MSKKVDPRTTSVLLQDNELMLLDGKCRKEVQVEVNKARARLKMVCDLEGAPEHIACFVSDVLSSAEANGMLDYCTGSSSYCLVCKTSAGYASYKKSGPYHKKGEPNIKKPQSFGMVLVSHSLRCCYDCWNKAKPFLETVLDGVLAEIPEKITGKPPEYFRFSIRVCNKCGWKGNDVEAGVWEDCSQSSRRYKGTCPKCNTEARAWNAFKILDQFVILSKDDLDSIRAFDAIF